MKASTVAICIPTYNQSPYLEGAVESALRQTHQDVEVWISDDASTDDTAEVGRRLASRHSNVSYHRQERNLGIGANNNWVLRQPQTAWILRLDSDDRLAPEYIARLLPELESQPQAAYAHGAVQEIDENGSFRRVRRLVRPAGFQPAEVSLRAMASGYRVAANICLFRASALRDLGFYREGMNFCEDWDLAIRLADRGWGNIYCPEILAQYRMWKNHLRVSATRKATEISGCLRVYEDGLQPAFQRREWSAGILNRRRRMIAMTHTADLDAYAEEDRVQLEKLLRQLGDSSLLDLRLVLIRMGLGRLFRWLTRIKLHLKDLVKGFLRREAAQEARS